MTITSPPSSRPTLLAKQPPAKLRRQSTFERQPPATQLSPPTTPTLLGRANSRSHSTPPQHTLVPSASLGESIFQSLSSFGPFSATAKPTRSPPASRAPTMLANVLESPTAFDPTSETPAAASVLSAARRRVTSPDSHPFDPTRAGSPSNSDTYTSGAAHRGNSSPRSTPLTFGDTHPRKARSTLRLSRLRPATKEGSAIYGPPVPDTAPSTVPSSWDTRPSSAGGNSDRGMQRAIPARRPGSAGEMARKNSLQHPTRDGNHDGRPTSSGKGRGMRVRASSELTRPPASLSTILHEVDEPPPTRLTRPSMLLSSAGASTLAPVPVSPGVLSTWSKQSGESALADDSDVDADVPTTPSLTTSHTGSRSNSGVKESDRSQGLSSTPKPSAPILDSDVLDRSRAREDADRRRRGEAAREREERQSHSKYFKLKGPQKEKCHAFSVKEAPYPVSYSPKILDHYNLDVELTRSTISGLTYLKFEVPPANVLDLGCGTGYWILQAAREWTETEFVGFDLVPIQPNLERVTGKSGVSINGSGHADLRLSERIRWVHGNFLQKLPFPDAQFDMVRCRRIARGVPESSWDCLYEEIVRVMKPGAAFEQTEEDIIFPAEISNTPNIPSAATYPTPAPTRTLPTPPYLSSTSLPSVRPPDHYRRSPSTSFSSVLESPVEGRNGVPSVSSMSSASLNSHEPLMTQFTSSSSGNPHPTLVIPGSVVSTPHPDATPARDSRGSGESVGGHQAPDYSFYDPRSHTRLEELYVSMHEARWINLKPLSLIPRLIQEHMTGMISSPPVNMCLPHRPREGPPLSRMVGVVEVARASGDASARQLMRVRAKELGNGLDEQLFAPQPGDDEVARHITFDLTRIGAMSKMMPVGKFQMDLGWLPMHMSSVTAEVLGCKEAMWEFLQEREPGFDRREFDALIKQYQTDVQDRIGLGEALRAKLHWGPPASDIQRTPEQRVFDENYTRAVARDQAESTTQTRHPRVMRCVRSFVAWKAKE